MPRGRSKNVATEPRIMHRATLAGEGSVLAAYPLRTKVSISVE
jgi:hypothetical protein